MAAFDWLDYLNLAKRLLENGDEASHRTAISRAYYYAYHLALSRAEQNGYRAPHEIGSHRDLWRVYTTNPEPRSQKLGNLGEHMLRKRIMADYRLSFSRVREQADEMVDDAIEFADLLAKLEPRHPKQSSQRR